MAGARRTIGSKPGPADAALDGTPMSPRDPELSRWFDEHVRPHEPMLRAWLAAKFPREAEIDDIVQEAFARLVRAYGHVTIGSPKAFLFATARNVVLARLRQRRGAPALSELGGAAADEVRDEGADVPQAVARAQELELLTAAIQALPERCRQVLTLRKLYGLSQKEVAAQLGIAEHTVEAQGTIGLRKLAEYFARFEARGGKRHG